MPTPGLRPSVTSVVGTLARLPRVPVALVIGACLLAGLLLPAPWSALLLPVLLLMAALTAAAWPALLPAQRALRVMVLAVLGLALVTRTF